MINAETDQSPVKAGAAEWILEDSELGRDATGSRLEDTSVLKYHHLNDRHLKTPNNYKSYQRHTAHINSIQLPPPP